MSSFLWTRFQAWTQRGRFSDKPRAPRSRRLGLEVLEGRALPSSGPGGPSVPSPVHAALVQPLTTNPNGGGAGGQSGSGSLSVPHGPRLAEVLPLPGQPGIPIQDIFSGYPLPPSSGPQLTGPGLLTTTYVSTLPVTMQDSAVAVIPVAVTGLDNSTIQNMTPPAGYNVSVITVATANGPTTFMVLSFTGTVPISSTPVNPAPVVGN